MQTRNCLPFPRSSPQDKRSIISKVEISVADTYYIHPSPSQATKQVPGTRPHDAAPNKTPQFGLAQPGLASHPPYRCMLLPVVTPYSGRMLTVLVALPSSCYVPCLPTTSLQRRDKMAQNLPLLICTVAAGCSAPPACSQSLLTRSQPPQARLGTSRSSQQHAL